VQPMQAPVDTACIERDQLDADDKQ